jgi:hypothetical protein
MSPNGGPGGVAAYLFYLSWKCRACLVVEVEAIEHPVGVLGWSTISFAMTALSQPLVGRGSTGGARHVQGSPTACNGGIFDAVAELIIH